LKKSVWHQKLQADVSVPRHGKVSSATENATIDQKKCPEWQLRQRNGTLRFFAAVGFLDGVSPPQ
jgi:hypothetical protein